MSPTVQATIKQFLSQYIRNYELQDDDDIFALGFVNSLFAMQLVVFVETTFQLKVEDIDLTLDNFRSISAMTNFIESKRLVVGR